MHAEGVLSKFCHVLNFKTPVDRLLGKNVWRLNKSSRFRKQKYKPFTKWQKKKKKKKKKKARQEI